VSRVAIQLGRVEAKLITKHPCSPRHNDEMRFIRALLATTTFLALLQTVASEDKCDNCTDCTDSATALVGRAENIVSPECEEGSVATITRLETIDDSGDYEIITWNPGATTWTDSITSPYKHEVASQESRDVASFCVSDEDLPVIGDQSKLKVTLNCEWTRCDFRWNITFDCAKLGVLTNDTNGGVQVLSDIDDTIVCPNPQGPTDPHSYAGVDKRLEAKELYPGVAELLLGLALGNSTDYVPARPMMLSARPREAGVLSISQGSQLNLYMEEVGDRNSQSSWGVNIDSSLYGTLLDGTSFNEFGETKAKSYNQVSSERPNTRFAFLGDNGQGDVCAAQSMFMSENGDRLMAVFIHLTEDPSESITACEDPTTGEFTLNLTESDSVHYHKTHSDATLWAFKQGLIRCCSAFNVYTAVQEWVDCRCDGVCDYELPTGVSEQATREETLAYCENVKADQALLNETIAECDADGACPVPSELPTPGVESNSGASALVAGSVVTTILAFLLVIGLLS
jgi:hypothetical protein